MNESPASRIEPIDPAEAATRAVTMSWAQGVVPEIETLWRRLDPRGSLAVLAAMVKEDLKCRYERGERPDISAYLERFPPLKDDRDRVVSLVYAEYCLREGCGETLNPDSFCKRYEPWRDSLASQLRYHRVLSHIAGKKLEMPKFPSPGQRFSTFRLRSVLGEGGSARVFLAADEQLGNRVVALKISAANSEEPTIQGRLDHANIVPVHSVHSDPETGLRGLSMPYRKGLPLDEVIGLIQPRSRPRNASVLREVLEPDREIPLDGSEAAGWVGFPTRGTYAQGVAWIVAVVARALAYAHANNVLHRDVKPANVLLAVREGPQLLDFNLAHSPHAANQAEEALRGGTLPYMAPEQLEAFLDPERWDTVNEAADIYSVGLLLSEMLTGIRPEAPEPEMPLPWAIREMLDRRLTSFGSIRMLNPDVPHALDAIISRCLAVRPDHRYPSAKAAADDLMRFVEHRPLALADNPSRTERVGNWVHHSKAKLFGSLLAVGVVAFLAAALVMSNRKSGSDADAMDPLARVTWADRLRAAGDFDKARAELRKILAAAPDLFQAHWGMATLEVELNRVPQALAEFEKGSHLWDRPNVKKSEAGAFFMFYALQLSNQGNRLKSEEMYRKAIEVFPDPRMHLAYRNLAELEGARKNFADALAHIDKAIVSVKSFSQNPASAAPPGYTLCRCQILMNQAIGVLGVEAGNLKNAREKLAEAEKDLLAIRTDPGTLKPNEAYELEVTQAGVLIGLGDLASRAEDHAESLGHFEKAEACVQAALTLQPKDERARKLLTDVQFREETEKADLIKK